MHAFLTPSIRLSVSLMSWRVGEYNTLAKNVLMPIIDNEALPELLDEQYVAQLNAVTNITNESIIIAPMEVRVCPSPSPRAPPHYLE